MADARGIVGDAPLNVGFVGGQHAGKTAVMNSISKTLPGFRNTPAFFKSVGRLHERGTMELGVFERPGSRWRFLDSAGRGFNPQGADGDKAYLVRLKQGLKEFTDLINPNANDPHHPGWALESSTDHSNKMEAIVYVLNAELLVGTQAVVRRERHNLFWTKEVTEQKEVLTISQVQQHLKLFYDTVHELTGWYPFVVVTHMDTVSSKYSEEQIRELLNNVVHEDRVYFMSCIKLAKDEVAEDTRLAVTNLLEALQGHIEFYRTKQQPAAVRPAVAAAGPAPAYADVDPPAIPA